VHAGELDRGKSRRAAQPGYRSIERKLSTHLILFPSRFRNKLKAVLFSISFMASSSRPRFALVVSTYNHEFTDALLAAALAALGDHPTETVRVPGAFEIPLQVQRLARSKRFAAVLALGLVWQGKTSHAQEITRAVTDALMRISLETNVPVLHEVLAIKTEAEARARCMGKKLNRGREAAEAALVMASLSQVGRN
jgi:6,7-dimethyl-8-ribityllumazine synthase